jgi:hypothetical protein
MIKYRSTIMVRRIPDAFNVRLNYSSAEKGSFIRFWIAESPTTRGAGGLDFSAMGRQAVPQANR